MKKKISMKTIRELYRVDAKYWKTGDTDLLEKRMRLSMDVDERFWDDMGAIMSIVTRKHYPVQRFVDVIKLLGFDVEDEFDAPILARDAEISDSKGENDD